MMKKYLRMSFVLFQVICIFPAEKQNRRTSDPRKCRITLSQSQPIPIASGEKLKEVNRLSQSSPNLLQAYSPYHYSPNGYYEFGNLSEGFSPATYDSKR